MRDSVRTGRNFSPARKVLSCTEPSSILRSFVRTNAPPLPGLTCWNSTILKTDPSISMWLPFLNWLVEITAAESSSRCDLRRALLESHTASDRKLLKQQGQRCLRARVVLLAAYLFEQFSDLSLAAVLLVVGASMSERGKGEVVLARVDCNLG